MAVSRLSIFSLLLVGIMVIGLTGCPPIVDPPEEGETTEGEATEGETTEGETTEGEAVEGEGEAAEGEEPPPPAKTYTVNFDMVNDDVEGITNVGVGSTVALTSQVAEELDVDDVALVLTETWVLTAPDGSEAALDAETNSFVADVEGSYAVSLTVTGGAAELMLEGAVTASTYAGVGIVLVSDAGEVTLDEANCSGCHSDTVDEWLGTHHATKLIKEIDNWAGASEEEYHYAGYCLPCHTTGYDAGAENGGFDDGMGEWSVPAWSEDMSGNYANLVETVPAAANLGGIQCESCHGPGTAHKAGADATLMYTDLDSDNCDQCHHQGDQLANSGHSDESSRSWTYPTGAGHESCMPCHSGEGFVDMADGDSSDDARNGIQTLACSACHDPHSDENPAQLRVYGDATFPGGAVVSGVGSSATCVTCHNGRVAPADLPNGAMPHYAAAGPVLYAVNGFTFGKAIESSPHSSFVGCADCHMAISTPLGDIRGETHEFENTVGAHSFNMEHTNEAEETYLNIEMACGECHPSMEEFNRPASADYDGNGVVEGVEEEINGLLDIVIAKVIEVGQSGGNADFAHLDHYPYWTPGVADWDGEDVDDNGDPIAVTGLDLDPAVLETLRQAAWNWSLISHDAGAAYHNTDWAVGLLQASYEALEGAPLAGAYLLYQ
jgi:hypothetical protein